MRNIINEKRKAQSVVVGFIIILGIFVVFLSWFQLTQMPFLNQDAENQQHDETVIDIQDFSENIEQSIVDDTVNEKSIRNNVNYPIQLATIPNSMGVLRNSSTYESITFQNENITEKNSDTSLNINFSQTTQLQYETEYIEIEDSVFTYEYNTIIEEKQNSTTVRSQRFINNENINLYSIGTNFNSVKATNPQFRIIPIDSKESYQLEAENEEENIELEFESTLSQETWKDILDIELQENIIDIHFEESEIESEPNTITIELKSVDGDNELITYTLNIGSVNIQK